MSVSARLREIAGDLAEIAGNPPNDMDSQAMARLASQLLAVAGQVALGEQIDPRRLQDETSEVLPLDLMRLARAEFRRYADFASAGAFEMFSSAALARELVAEAIDRMEQQS